LPHSRSDVIAAPVEGHSRTLGHAAKSPASECSRVRGTVAVVAHYLFNFVSADESERSALLERAAASLRASMWGIDTGERHRDALAPGDLVLVYVGAPALEFIGRAELASAAQDWTPTKQHVYPGGSPGGVLLAHVEEWDPPVPVHAVLSEIDSPAAKAEFEAGVVQITAREYATAVSVAARRASLTE
jgi:hypothetical protein